MKINQVVGEHKKGVRAKVYTKKGPEPRHVPKRTQQGPVATAFAETATLGDYQAGRTATIKDPEHGKEYTLDLTKPENMAALHPNDQGQIEFNPDFDPAGGGLGAQAQGQEQTPLQPGAPIEIKTSTEEDIGGDAGDDFIDDVVDHDFERAQGRLRELAGMQAGTAPQQQAATPPQQGQATSAAASLDSAEGFKQAIKQAAGESGIEADVNPMIDKLVVAAPDGTVDAEKSLTNMMSMAGGLIPQFVEVVEGLISAFENAARAPEFATLDPEAKQSVLDAIQEMKAQLPVMQRNAQAMQQQIATQQQQPAPVQESELTRWLKIAGLR